MRRAGKRDANEAAIVADLRKCGRRVVLLGSDVPGIPDLLVYWPGGMALLEVKEAKGVMSATQIAWHRAYCGPPGTLHVVRTSDEALAACGLRR